MITFIITMIILGGGGLLAVSLWGAHRYRAAAQARGWQVRREQMLFEQRLNHLTQLAVGAMRAEVRRSNRHDG